MDYFSTGFSLVISLIIIILLPISLEKTNAKRAAKGKPALTEDEFTRMVKIERIIAAIILAAGFIIATLIREFV
jgi:hypothetical protein